MNITIRVSGRQAQQQLRAVSQELSQVQRMVGKTPTIQAPSSPWSPRIAQQQARQAESAARQAAAAQARAQQQADRQAIAQAKRTASEQSRILSAEWNRQQVEYRQHLANMTAQQKAADAKQLQESKRQESETSKLGGLSPLGFAKNIGASQLINAGKNINWVGRQLTYNFTLPIAAAGVSLFKFSQDVERSTIQLKKVYGDIGDDQAMLRAETDALSTSFELLSTRYGINQKEVIDIAAAWAAAGAAGAGLAEATKATLETMLLGDMDASKATEALIAIQGQWHFSTLKGADGVSELTTQLAYLNAIENATGISTQGLVDVIQKAGGNARTSGASLRELAALAAALVPATGDAAQAGTALRSIISSLSSPTAQATEALGLMGITVSDPKWLGANSVDKLRILSDHFVKLSDAQQGVVSSVIATKWQVARFDVLMRDIASGTGYFQKALDVTASSSDALAIRQRELETILQSSPKAWDIMTNATRNALAKAFVPMIPAIMSIVKLISDLAFKFEHLNPQLQKWIMIGLAAIAMLGPLLSILGSTMQLLGVFGAGLGSVAKVIFWFVTKALGPLIEALGSVAIAFAETAAEAVGSFLVAIGPIGWAIIAAIAAITAAVLIVLHTDLEDKVWEIIKSVASAFWELPKAIANAFLAVVHVIGSFMTGIVDALSYLNPFARHSPSLVDNVTNGVSTILSQYGRFSQIPGLIASANSALQNFSAASAGPGRTFRQAELQAKADKAGQAAPGIQPAATGLVHQIMNLEAQLPALERAISAQEAVVKRWTDALKDADSQIDAMQKHLDGLESQYNSLGDQIEAANKRIGELADTPIQGMTALGDAIFDNQLAQNKLNMELLQFEREGYTLDKIKDKYASMAGEIETLRGTQAELRGAGAGSDILSWYDDQVSAIQDQKKEMGGVEKQIVDINKQLDALDLEGRFLELTKAINFDPLERQLDKIANKVVEMPFDEIVRKIREQQAIVQQLQPQYDALGAAVDREKASIDAAKNARDAMANTLDVEQQKLDNLKQMYSDVKDLISEMEGNLNSFVSAMDKATDDASRMAQLFDAAAGLDFPDQGGTAPLGREGGLPEIQQFNDDLQKEIEDALQGMGAVDLLGPIQDAINKLKDLDFLGPIKLAWQKVEDWLGGLGQWIMDHLWAVLFGAFWFAGGSVIALFLGAYEIIKTYGPIVWNWIWENIVKPVGEALQDGWEEIKKIWKWIFDNLIQPVIDFGVKIYNFLEPIVATVFGVVVSIITTAWEIISSTAKTAWGIISGAFEIAWSIIQPVLSAIWNFINDYIVPILQLFQVTTEIVLKVIGLLFMWLWDNILDVVFKLIKAAIGVVVDSFNWWKDRAIEILGYLGDTMKWWYDNVIAPIFGAFQWAADNVIIPAFNWIWSEAGRIFGSLANTLEWIWDNVIAPIWDKFQWAFENVIAPAFRMLRDKIIKPIMKSIFSAIAAVWNAIAGVIEGGVNFFVDAFNAVGSAVNAVAGFLQIDAKVGTMPHITLPRLDVNYETPMDPAGPPAFAAGGIPAANAAGGRYAAPRAIVGEGSNFYPEFVIPTDPHYRKRALAFWQEAGTRLMADGGIVDETLYDTVGNWQGDIQLGAQGTAHGTSWMQSVINAVAATGRLIEQGAIAAIWKPLKFIADHAIDLIPNATFKGAGLGIMNSVDAWVMGRDQEWNAIAANMPAPAGDTGAGGVGYTGTGATAQGIPITHSAGSWHAFVDLLHQMGIPYTNLGTYANRLTARTHVLSYHALDRAMDFGGTQMQLQRIDHALYDAFKPYLHELIWTGPDSRNVFNGQDHVFRSDIAADHTTHVHASMAQGGRFYVPRTPGGVNVNVSEGRQGEQFQVLPVDDSAAGGTTIVINGNLEFPNIKSGADAKDFIDNLRALATN